MFYFTERKMGEKERNNAVRFQIFTSFNYEASFFSYSNPEVLKTLFMLKWIIQNWKRIIPNNPLVYFTLECILSTWLQNNSI